MNTARPPLCLEPGSPSWPADLDHIDGRPERIWLRGRVELLEKKPRIAVVGSRSPTPYGEAQARRFAYALAEAGATIVSGLARGIDSAAHRAALDANGATIAVLGSGVDRPWPTGPLTDEMHRRALLLSEFQPGESPRPHHFPLRNRLISGLCLGVIVIEAAHASGSLITARWAADQGRTVWALPGRVDHPMSRGSHRLIREGATLVESPEEIVREILGEAAVRGDARADRGTQLTREEQCILAVLQGETLDADAVAARTEIELQTVLATLVALEVADLVVRAPGGLYRRGR
ncbi:MAG: DNA-protecting protein DprA [Planctomycetes bacterium]|nr:DNA-protecting protein DprA [Planctomycetota bacterium]